MLAKSGDLDLGAYVPKMARLIWVNQISSILF